MATRDVVVTALKPFEYRDRYVRAGSKIAMAPIDVAIRSRRQEVSLAKTDGIATPNPPPRRRSTVDPEEPATRRGRRQYRRRDMVAESSVVPVVEDVREDDV